MLWPYAPVNWGVGSVFQLQKMHIFYFGHITIAMIIRIIGFMIAYLIIFNICNNKLSHQCCDYSFSMIDDCDRNWLSLSCFTTTMASLIQTIMIDLIIVIMRDLIMMIIIMTWHCHQGTDENDHFVSRAHPSHWHNALWQWDGEKLSIQLKIQPFQCVMWCQIKTFYQINVLIYFQRNFPSNKISIKPF